MRVLLIDRDGKERRVYVPDDFRGNIRIQVPRTEEWNPAGLRAITVKTYGPTNQARIEHGETLRIFREVAGQGGEENEKKE